MIGRAAIAVLLSGCLGCATIAPKAPSFHDEPLRTGQAEIVRKDGAHVTIEQHDTVLTIVAARACDVIDRPTVNRTITTEYENKSTATDWLLAGSGVGVAGTGVGFLVDAHSVNPTDRSSRTYNPVGPTGATVIGISGIAVGAGLLAVSVADVVRAHKITVGHEEVTSNGPNVKTDIGCANERVIGTAVRGKVGYDVFDLGKTDAAGKLNVDLNTALDPEWVVPSSAKTMAIMIEGAMPEAGTVDLAPLFAVREEHAWQGVVGTVPTCASPTTSKACDPLKAFLAKYPGGPHGGPAHKTVEDSAPKVHALADEEMWQVREADVRTCGGTKLDTPENIDGACASAQAYISAFTDGQHRKEAEAALKAGRARSALLTAEIERKRKAAEDAERRRLKAEEDAEVRKEAARQAQAKSDCIRLIQSACARAARYRGIPYDICYRQTMEAQSQCSQR